MREYERTRWYGLHYFKERHGTVLPRLIPPVIISSTIAVLITWARNERYGPLDVCPGEDTLFYHPFILGATTLTMGSITVARFNISYARYWDGVTQVKMMHSKWTDALIQILAFDRVETDSEELLGEPFCEHMVRLFQQLSALATIYLQGETFTEISASEKCKAPTAASDEGSDVGEVYSSGVRPPSPGPMARPPCLGGAQLSMVGEEEDKPPKPHSCTGPHLSRSRQGDEEDCAVHVEDADLECGNGPSNGPSFTLAGVGYAVDGGLRRSDTSGSTTSLSSTDGISPRPAGLSKHASSTSMTRRRDNRHLAGSRSQSHKHFGSWGRDSAERVPSDCDSRISAIASFRARQASFTNHMISGASNMAHNASKSVNARAHASAQSLRVSMGRRKTLKKAAVVTTSVTDRLQDCFTAEEREFLHRAPDKLHTQMSRISRSITTRHHAGGIRAPPPIVSRVFQEMSNGALAYNAATRIVEIPVPFILVHLHALLLVLLIFFAPLILSCYIGHVAMSIFASGVVVSGFSGLWLVANELEDPFGSDDNDMPMIMYHDHFVAAIESSLSSPWLPMDQWVERDGAWRAWHPTDAYSKAGPPEATGRLTRQNSAKGAMNQGSGRLELPSIFCREGDSSSHQSAEPILATLGRRSSNTPVLEAITKADALSNSSV